MKRIVAFLLLAVMLLGLVACTTAPATPTETEDLAPAQAEAPKEDATATKADYTIGVSLYYRRDEFYKDLESGMIAAAKELGVTLKLQDADTDPAKQVDQFESFAATKVDAIAAAITDPSGLIPTVNATASAGIPVFAFDGSTTDNEGMTSYIGMDNYQAGVTAGEWVKDYVDSMLGGAGNVVILDLPSSAVVCGARVEGFRSVIDTLPDVEIVAQQDGKASRTDSMTAMENILQANDKVDVIFGINDDTCFGAIAALESAGRKDVAVISVGWSKEMFEMLENKNEYFRASAVQNPYTMGTTAIKTVVEFLQTGAVEAKVLDKAVLVTQESISDFDWRSVIDQRTT